MNEIVNKGFILHIKEIEEFDALLYVLLAEGKVITLRAKGFQKETSKNRQAVNVHSFCELEYFQSEDYPYSGRLKRATSVSIPKPENINWLNQLNLVSQLLLHFQKRQFSEDVYLIVERITKNIDYKLSNVTNIFYFLNLLFMEEKYVQTTDKCSLCGFKDKISGFSLKDGGLVCRACDRDGIYDLPVETLRKVITLFKIDKIEQLQLINFLPAEESNLVEMFYHFASDVLGWNVELLKRI